MALSKLLFVAALTASLWTVSEGQSGNGGSGGSGGSGVAASAELVVVPGDSTATEGNTLILTCVGFGVPLPNVYFSRNGTQLTTNNSRVSIFTEVVEEQGLEFVQVTLQICGLDRELDTGNYSCTANNSNGTQTSSFEVTVNAFETVEIIIEPNDGIYLEGNTVIFTCVFFGTPTSPNVTWWRNGEEVDYSSGGSGDGDVPVIRIYEEIVYAAGTPFVMSNLEICGITGNQSGVYSCSASLPTGLTASSGNFSVNVSLTAPEIVMAPDNSEVGRGNTAIFTCVALYDPPATVSWTFNGNTIYNDTNTTVYSRVMMQQGLSFTVGTLELCGVTMEDIGQYSCVASGGGLDTTADFYLSVVDQDPPEIVIAPSNTTVDVYNTAFFTCVAETGSSMNTTITWVGPSGEALMNDSRISIYSRRIVEGGKVFVYSLLEICGLELNDTGYYYCVAENEFGDDRSSFVVTVDDIPLPEIVIAPSDGDVIEGNTILFTCVVPIPLAHVQPQIRWQRNDTGVIYNTTDDDITIYNSVMVEGGVPFLYSILEICGVEQTDGGRYFCEAGYGFEPGRSVRSYFDVTVIQRQDVEIVIAPSNSTVKEDTTVLLTCVVFGIPLPTNVSWIFTPSSSSSSSYYLSNYSPTEDLNLRVYTSEVNVDGIAFLQSILEICGVDREQAGYYSCFAENSDGNDTASFTLEVDPQDAPTIVVAPDDAAPDLGSTIILLCVAHGNPFPNISWLFDNELLDNSSTSENDSTIMSIYNSIQDINGVLFAQSILEICGVTVEEEGRYSCVAENEINSTRSEFYVNVLVPPVVAIQPSDGIAAYGSTLLLICVVASLETNPYLPVEALWFRGSDLLRNSTYSSDDNATVTIYDTIISVNGVNFTQSVLELCGVTLDDEGMYGCQANDSAGTSDLAPFNISVFTNVSLVITPESLIQPYAGSTILFTCVATGIPDPTISWFRGDSQITPDNRHNITVTTETINGVTFVTSILQICNLVSSDQTSYSCVAMVPRMQESASFEVQLQLVAADITQPPMDVTVVTGTMVTLTCEAVGAPLPTITWTRDGVVILNAMVSETVISVTQLNSTLDLGEVNETATYTCTASNHVTDTASANVTVQYPLEVISNPSDRTNVHVGYEVTFSCAMSGFPPPLTIQWFESQSPDTPLSNSIFTITVSDDNLSSNLTFTTVLSQHNTSYFCQAQQMLVNGSNVTATSGAATLTLISPPMLAEGNNMLPAVLNGTLTLTFVINNAIPPVTEDSVVWSFRPNGTDNFLVIGPNSNNSRFTFSFSETYVQLRIHPVQADDEGNFSVSVSNSVDSDNITVSVDVVIGAYITDPPDSITRHVGLNATFSCSATAEPLHTVVWLFNGVDLINDDDKYIIFDVNETTSMLTIVDVTGGDDGEYTCDVVNEYGNDTAPANLTVISTPNVEAITESPIRVAEGRSVSLQFSVTDSLPPVAVTSADWLFTANNGSGSHTLAPEDPRFEFSDDFTELVISSLHQFDEGTYTLTVTNAADLTGQASIFLDVEREATIDTAPMDVATPVGGDSTFTCVASGEPIPDILWLFDDGTEDPAVLVNGDKYSITETVNELQESRTSELVVTMVTEEDGGVYSCNASNDHGFQIAGADLQPLRAPMITLSQQPVPVLYTNQVTLTVTIVQDLPPVTPDGISWYFVRDAVPSENTTVPEDGKIGTEIVAMGDGSEFSEDRIEFSADRRSLVISDIRYSDEGYYTVVAINSAGNDSDRIRVDVQAAPVATATAMPPRQHEGSMATIVCDVIAEPAATVTFRFLDNEELDLTDQRYTVTSGPGTMYYEAVHSLTISDLMTSDAGSYVCDASNIHNDSVTSEPTDLEVLVEAEVMADQNLYQFISGQVNVSISFTSSGREYPLLVEGGVVVWFMDREGVVSAVNSAWVRFERLDNEGMILSPSRVTVVFSQIGPTNNGTYWVAATNDAGTTNSTVADVEVFVNPTVMVTSPTQLTINETLNVTLTCVATGNPSPTITWNKDEEFILTTGSRIQSNQMITSEVGTRGQCLNTVCNVTGTLFISSLSERDTGVYRCAAAIDNEIPGGVQAASQVISLTVLEVEFDDCASDPCLNGATCDDVGDGFLCMCPNNFIGVNCETEVEILSPPIIVQGPQTVFLFIPASLLLPCFVTGNPQPAITWWKDGVRIEGEVQQILFRQELSLEDRGEYFCVAKNSEEESGTVESDRAIVNIENIIQFLVRIVFNFFFGRRRRQVDEADQASRLIATLNEQFVGTMIENATVFSVNIQEGVNVSALAPGDEIPLVFTFFTDEVEEEPTIGPEPVDPGPQVISIDVTELERIIEEDVMLVAMELGLNITIEEFVRFDGCTSEMTSVGMDRNLPWVETALGGVRTVPCPCEVLDLQKTATRQCGGNFTAGADWMDPIVDQCLFDDLTISLCFRPELNEIGGLLVEELTVLDVAVVTQLVVDLINSTLGNTTESDAVFGVIDEVLDSSADTLLDGQVQFNTSGQLLSTLEILVDSYRNTEEINVHITRYEAFRFIIIPDSQLPNGIATVSVDAGNNIIVNPVTQARARVDLPLVDDLGIVVGVYNTPALFTSRPEFIAAQNRTNYVLGSTAGVVTVHFSGKLDRIELNNPIKITFWKTEEAENRTRTECVFWDQSLDEEYGAWSSEGCEVMSDTSEVTICVCDHLSQFALLVDLTQEITTQPPVTREPVDEDDSIRAGSYVGGLICILFLFFIVLTYLLSSELRVSPLGLSLINTCCCLSALFISFIVSYYTTDNDWCCIVFSAIFHYLFLVTSVSLLTMALFKTMKPERPLRIFLISLIVQFILPALVVIVSAAPDRDNYFSDEFCRPQREPYWYGLLLAGGLIHLVAWVILITGLCLVRVRGDKISTEWFEQWLGIALTLVVFEVAWGFGLPATNSLGLGAARLVFQIIFVIGCVVLGVVMVIFFVFLLREPREVWTGLINRCIPGRTGGFNTSTHMTYGISIRENPYAGSGGSAIEMSSSSTTGGATKVPLRDDEDISAAKRSPEASTMIEKVNGEDPEAIVNPAATEQDDEDGGVEMETTEVKVDIGMYDDDGDAAKDTRL